MSDSIRRELAAALDTNDTREVRAQQAAEVVRAAREYRWVGIYDVDDDRIELLGHTGPEVPVFVEFSSTEGLSGEVVRTRSTVVSNDVGKDPRYLTAFETTGSEMIVPILGAESGIVIGTLDVESERVDAFSDDDRDFVERCATALMPLFE
ncbi:MAG: GAF domain-containing protein [Candidatus Eremiobacteraeota bacterium]|nr:GAF domain-containing protein [Candidatus Eremiobacteraeota bacterium]